jgi:hypothetical protein
MTSNKNIERWIKGLKAETLTCKETFALASYLIRSGEIEHQEPDVQNYVSVLVLTSQIDPDGTILVLPYDDEHTVRAQG